MEDRLKDSAARALRRRLTSEAASVALRAAGIALLEILPAKIIEDSKSGILDGLTQVQVAERYTSAMIRQIHAIADEYQRQVTVCDGRLEALNELLEK